MPEMDQILRQKTCGRIPAPQDVHIGPIHPEDHLQPKLTALTACLQMKTPNSLVHMQI